MLSCCPVKQWSSLLLRALLSLEKQSRQPSSIGILSHPVRDCNATSAQSCQCFLPHKLSSHAASWCSALVLVTIITTCLIIHLSSPEVVICFRAIIKPASVVGIPVPFKWCERLIPWRLLQGCLPNQASGFGFGAVPKTRELRCEWNSFPGDTRQGLKGQLHRPSPITSDDSPSSHL